MGTIFTKEAKEMHFTSFIKKALCVLLAAALLLAVPCGALAMESEDFEDSEGFSAQAGGPAAETDETEFPQIPEQDQPTGQNEPAEQEEPAAEEGLKRPPAPDGVYIAPGEDTSIYPTVRIVGGQHPLFYDEGTDDQRAMFDPKNLFTKATFGFILTELFNPAIWLNWKFIKQGIFSYYWNVYWKFFEDCIIQALWNAYGMLEMDGNGDSIDPDITCNIYWQWVVRPWDNNECTFTYDWRLDPWDVAEKLEECILSTGSEKVNIVSTSGSGPILLAYLERYKTDRVASALFNISLHSGTTLFGDFATMKPAINARALGNTSPLPIMAVDIPGLSFDPLKPLLRLMYEIGLIDAVGKIVNLGVAWAIPRVYDEAVIPIFFKMPAMWSYVPSSQYEEAKKLLLKGDPKYAGLVERIDRYQYQIMARQNEIIQEAAAKAKVAVRTGYGIPLYGISQGAYTNSDDFVDTEYASFGATCAPLDRPFPASYQQKAPGDWNYISPDRLVDASTCALPSLTWLTKDQVHRGEASFNGWYEWFLRAEGDYSVFANPDYPQYSQFVKEHEYAALEFKPRPAILDYLLSAVLWVMKAWRFVILLPLFWTGLPVVMGLR